MSCAKIELLVTTNKSRHILFVPSNNFTFKKSSCIKTPGSVT